MTISQQSLSSRPFCDVARRVRWHRHVTLLSQTAYAKKLGIGQGSIGDWESGNHCVSAEGAMRFNAVFGLPSDFLFFGVTEGLPGRLRREWDDYNRELLRYPRGPTLH